MSDAWIDSVAGSPWLFPTLFALVVGDEFLVVLPSETAVVALGAIAGATGDPPLTAVVATAAGPAGLLGRTHRLSIVRRPL